MSSFQNMKHLEIPELLYVNIIFGWLCFVDVAFMDMPLMTKFTLMMESFPNLDNTLQRLS